MFCRLTPEQRSMYQAYLDSYEIKSIIDGRLQIFIGLTNLRKICNHPDLFQNESKEIQDMVAEIYKSFDEAYNRQDIKEVERILNLLENGSFSKIKKHTVNDKSKLEGIKEFLLTKISKVKKNLEELKENETYQDILEIKDWKEYFIELRIKLNNHLSELNKKLNTL